MQENCQSYLLLPQGNDIRETNKLLNADLNHFIQRSRSYKCDPEEEEVTANESEAPAA